MEQQNVAFLGPRRTGKTSCLQKIIANPPTGYVPIYMDLEQYNSPKQWLKATLDEVLKKLKKPSPKASWLVQNLTRIEEIKVMGQGIKLSATKDKSNEWRPIADELIRVLTETNKHIIFLLDEFPVFLNHVAKNQPREELENLLHWFRATRQELMDIARFLVTGSIGLQGIVRKLGLSTTINDFKTLEIPALSEKDGLKFLATLAETNGVPLTLTGRRHILKLLGTPWPILLQLFVSEIQGTGPTKAPTKKELTRIYRERLLQGGSRNLYCEGMFTRLKEIFSRSESRLARDIFKAVCQEAKGLTRDDFESIYEKCIPLAEQRALQADELDYVLDVLKHDGYLQQQLDGEQRTEFASNILRDFWQRKIS